MKKIYFFFLLFLLIPVGFYARNHSSNSSPTSSPTTTSTNTSTTQTTVSNTGKTPSFPLSAPSGFTVRVFAEGLGKARDLQLSPGGTLLVSDPNAGTVTALPDRNQDGVADEKKVVISGGNKTHGLAFYKNELFVAEVNKVSKYTWDEESLTAKLEKTLFTLPENNDHSLRTLLFDSSGNLYISVGSTCNVCVESDDRSGTIMISNVNGDTPRMYAAGLRNAPFLAMNSLSNNIWMTEMGRDNLGDDIPPDEIDILEGSGNYGWPYCYGNKIYDKNFNKQSPSFCTSTKSPIFEIPAHSAPLGLTFINSSQFPSDWQNDLLVSYHGSWNRSVKTGYKVVHMKVNGNTITSAEDFLTGFLNDSTVFARPVDLTFDSEGSLYVSDDQAGNVFKVTAK